jgi:tetratricopeptide (TPR) repeat protein
MNAVKEINGKNKKELREFEAELKSLVKNGKYAEAIEFSAKNRIVNYPGDECRLYSYKIMGVCYSHDIRNSWKDQGYKPSKYMASGDHLFDKGYYSKAVFTYLKAIPEDSDKAWYAAGCAYRATGNPYESVEAWDKAMAIVMKRNNAEKLESNPADAAVWAQRGDIDYNLEKWSAAVSSYDHSLAIDARQPKVWFRKGCSHFEMDVYQDALTAFKRVLTLQPDHYVAANDAAVALWSLEKYRWVMKYLEQAASNCPPDAFEYSLIQSNKEKAGLKEKKGKKLTFLC